MPLRLSCPKCSNGILLSEPYPEPGEQVQCPACAQGMAVTYPDGVVERLRERGKLFTRPAARPGPPQAPAPALPSRSARR
ncbi:MAG TPA: hypothetical protein PKA64_17270, partial [Myxococcota bacterium]|nr:hypothetical protein [Myxococcota bacterium]